MDLESIPEVPAANDNQAARWACGLVCIAGFFALIVIVTTTSAPLTFDEPWYLDTVRIFHKYGFSVEFLRKLPGPAGPLFTLTNAIFEPITHLSAPGVRLLNVGGLAVLIALTALLLKSRFSTMQSWLLALPIIALSVLWKSAGMALTEMPAMVFLTAFFACIAWQDGVAAKRSRVTLCMLAGAFLGIAIMGRQPCLVAIGAIPFLWRRSGDTVPLLIVILMVILTTLPVFWIWGGLVPPETAWVSSGIRLEFGILSFAYAAVLVLILAPTYLELRWQAILLALVLAITAQFFLFGTEYVPLLSVVSRRFRPALVTVYSRSVVTVMAAFGMLFIISVCSRLRSSVIDRMMMFMMVACLLLLLTPAKVTHVFSTRYMSMVAPALVFITARQAPSTWSKAGRLVIGILLGAVRSLVLLRAGQTIGISMGGVNEAFQKLRRGDNLIAGSSLATSHFNMKVVERLVDEHEQQRVDRSQRLYALLMLELWWQRQKQ